MRYVVFNRKGGVGKSTIAVNLAAVNAAEGKRTLVVDLDPQCNASQYLLGTDMAEAMPTVGDFFSDSLRFQLVGRKPRDFVHDTPCPNLFLLPGDGGLLDLHAKLESRHKIYKLRDLVRALDDFHTIIIDTPPALGFFTTSAMIAAERCLIPFDCDAFSRRALYQLLGAVRELREDHNPDLAITGVVVNFFQERARLPKQLVEELRHEDMPVLEPFLMNTIKVRESHQAHAPLVHLAPRHKLSEQLRALWRTIDDPR